jgi:hypothetical protein
MYAAMHRLRPHQSPSSASLIEPSAHGRDDNAPRIVRPQHTWRSPSAGVIGDHYQRFKRVINCGDRERCSICKMVPVGACLQSDQDVSKFLYLTNLDHIMSNKSNCPFCELLLACLSKPENGLFVSSHVSDHLKTNSKLGSFETSNSRLDWYRECSFLEQRSNESWPFGSTRDPSEATAAVEQATNLFLFAEDRDIHASSS